jgi:heptosyltransferase-2
LKRILVIRGGAIGDFILTLPAVKLLRDNFPDAHIEILGYKRIIALAEKRFYADATRSIDYAPLSRFFARDSELPKDLIDYFGSFDLVVSYLFDPDAIFADNLRRCGVAQLVIGSPKFNEKEHVAIQLATPLREVGLRLINPAAKLFPNESDRKAANEFLAQASDEIIAIHPGSGSEKKNWPVQHWIALGNALLDEKRSTSADFSAAEFPGGRSGERRSLIVISGEADESQNLRLRSIWGNNSAVRFATSLPLTHLVAILEHAAFIGHDSGIAHLAAAAGAKCVLLFGPTDPAVWAPGNENVNVLQAPEGDLSKLSFEAVCDALEKWRNRPGCDLTRTQARRLRHSTN